MSSTMTRNASTILGLFTLLIAYFVLHASSDVPRLISPQGCRMSWMSPSYLLQSEFNTSWTPLASRYSLWLYREVGWEPNQAMGLPVLFIPGNAGSSHQVRSIASSAARQYFSSPFVVSDEFTGRNVKPLDFYTVEFNEDLSAFHGPTLDSQIEYTSAAITYILSHYPPNTDIIIMGHSMGGIVGTALLPSDNISTLITMSTPHTLPPARFDARIEEIYERNRRVLNEDETPILSLCGGATDMMIPSESCILPEPLGSGSPYRRTVFTFALEGAWTGVGHREMVWCHQVRWRVARAALELGTVESVEQRAEILDRWLRDGSMLLSGGESGGGEVSLGEGEYQALPEDMRLVLNRPSGKRTYLSPIPGAGEEVENRTFLLYASQGIIANVGPHHASKLRASVHLCAKHPTDTSILCKGLAPTSLSLLPSPNPGKPFPVPDEGSDESEGVVLFETHVSSGTEGWIGVSVDAGEDNPGWVVGGFDHAGDVKFDVGLWDLIFRDVKISRPRSDDVGLRTRISLPRLPAAALLVYRLVPKTTERVSCTAHTFSPLLVHTSDVSEAHYYRLASNQPVFLHTHSSAPYVPPVRSMPSHGINLTIYSPGQSCHDITELLLAVDLRASVGRMGTRYPTTLVSWGVGVVSLLLFHSWSSEGQLLSIQESLGSFVRHRMPVLMATAGIASLFPLGPEYFLGIGHEMGLLRAVLAVLMVGLAVGVVCVSWWLLLALMWPLRILSGIFASRKREDVSVRRGTVVSMFLVLILIFLFVPWQVAFLGCWFIQLLNCTSSSRPKRYPGSAPTLASTPTDSRTEDINRTVNDTDSPSPAPILKPTFTNPHHQNTHILLLMTWLLPLAAPVLAVWVRTLQTAGYTTPFNGDHNVFKVAPMLLLVDYLGRGRPLEMMVFGRIPVRWGFVSVAVVAFLVGGRWTYLVYDAANLQMAVLLVSLGRSWFYG